MKSKRQEEILALIQEQNIETQNQLIEALRKRGVKSTQATLSRDIRELRLVKELSPDGGYRYTVPVREDSGDQLDRLRKIFRSLIPFYFDGLCSSASVQGKRHNSGHTKTGYLFCRFVKQQCRHLLLKFLSRHSF